MAAGFIPHPPIFLAQVRPMDLWLLLAVGCCWELLARLYLIAIKQKTRALLRKEDELYAVSQQVVVYRNKGPSAFVECSKLERQQNALELELQTTYEQRKQTFQRMEKVLLRYGNMLLAFIIFILYYGTPVVTIQGVEESLDTIEGKSAGRFLKAILFPISYVGVGAKIAKWGMEATVRETSIGALIVLWSSQVFTSKLMDAVEAYVVG